MEDEKGWKAWLRGKRTLSRHSDVELPETDFSSPSTPEPHEWPLRTILLGLYEVRGVHRGGGMGLVYRVHHSKWNIDLALKQPRAKYFRTPDQIQAFRAECDTWVRLGLHPHIACCYYVRIHEGVPLVFAEYLEGGSLEEWIDERTLYQGGPKRALERILDIGLQAGWALAYAHHQGLVHRDVKPANIVLTPDGVAKLTDFGLAAATSPSASTPGYRSPEQADRLVLTDRTDVWSWAVSILEMFAGGLTWSDGTLADRALQHWDPARVPEFVPRLPRPVSDVLRRCLRRKPEQRPSIPEAIGGLLAAYELVVEATYPRVDIRDAIARGDFKQSPIIAAGDLSNRALSLLDLAGDNPKLRNESDSMLRNWLNGHPRDPVPWCNLELLRVANGRLSISVLAREYLDTIAPKRPDWQELGVEPGQFLQLVSSHAVQHGASPIVRTLWSSLRRALYTASLDGSVWLWAAKRRGWEVEMELCGPRSGILDIWLEPDEWLIVGLQDGTVELRDGLEGKLVSSVHLGTNAHLSTSTAVRFVGRCKGDRGIIVAVESQGWFVLSLPDLHIRQAIQIPHGSIRACAEPADARYRIIGEDNGVIRLYGNSDSGVLPELLVPEQSIGLVEPLSRSHAVATSVKLESLRVSPNGKWAACGTREGALFLWQPEQAIHERTVSPRCWVYDGPIKAIAFSNESKSLCFADAEGWVRMMDLDALDPMEVVQIRLPISSLEVSREDDELAIGCSTGSILFQPLNALQQYELPFLITRPRSSEEHTRLKSRKDKSVRDARLALASDQFTEAYNLAKGGLEIAGGDADAEDQFREVLLCLPARRVGLHQRRLRWSSLNVYGSTTAIRVGPTVNGLATGSGRNVLVVGTDQGLHRLRATDGADLEKLEIPQIRALSYDEPSNSCVTAVEAGKVALMYFGSLGQIVQSPERSDLTSIVRLSGAIRGIAACGSANGTVVFWHGHDVFEWLHVMPSRIEALAVSPDSTWLAVAGNDGIVGCLDIATLRSLGALEGHQGAIRTLAFHPAGRFLASAGDDTTVRLWDVEKCVTVRVYEGHRSRVHALVFSPDGDWLASGDADGEIRLWCIHGDAHAVQQARHEEVSALAFDSGGGALYCGYRFGAICRWDLDWELDLSNSEVDRIRRLRLEIKTASTLAPRGRVDVGERPMN